MEEKENADEVDVNESRSFQHIKSANYSHEDIFGGKSQSKSSSKSKSKSKSKS
jgi:hypothetical protein